MCDEEPSDPGVIQEDKSSLLSMAFRADGIVQPNVHFPENLRQCGFGIRTFGNRLNLFPFVSIWRMMRYFPGYSLLEYKTVRKTYNLDFAD